MEYRHCESLIVLFPVRGSARSASMSRMTTPAEILRAIDALDPFNDPDYAPKVEALRREYIEPRLAEAEQEAARERQN